MTKGSNACVIYYYHYVCYVYIYAFINVRLNVTINILKHINYFIVLGVYICTCIQIYKVVSILQR